MRHDRPRRADSTRHQNCPSRRRRRADRRAVLPHGYGADAVRDRTGPAALDAARTRDPLARRAAGQPAHARPPVHGRPRGRLARPDRDGPDAAGTGLCGKGIGALARRRGAALCLLLRPLRFCTRSISIRSEVRWLARAAISFRAARWQGRKRRDVFRTRLSSPSCHRRAAAADSPSAKGAATVAAGKSGGGKESAWFA